MPSARSQTSGRPFPLQSLLANSHSSGMPLGKQSRLTPLCMSHESKVPFALQSKATASARSQSSGTRFPSQSVSNWMHSSGMRFRLQSELNAARISQASLIPFRLQSSIGSQASGMPLWSQSSPLPASKSHESAVPLLSQSGSQTSNNPSPPQSRVGSARICSRSGVPSSSQSIGIGGETQIEKGCGPAGTSYPVTSIRQNPEAGSPTTTCSMLLM